MEKVVDAAESGAEIGSPKLVHEGGAGKFSSSKGKGKAHSNSYLGKILAVEGSRDVAVGQPIAVTAQKGQLEVALEVSKKDDHWIADKKSYLAKILALEGSKDVPVDQPIAVTVDGVTVGSSIIKISRAAKLLIREHGLDASSLRASGAHGTLLKGDVLAAIKSGIGSSKGPLKEALARKDLKKDDHWVADEKRLDCWTAPLDGIMKINIDSLWRKLDTKCVLVVLVRNSYGVIQACLSRTTFCATPLDGEASAALLAVEVAETLGLSTYVLETSSTKLKTKVHAEKLEAEHAGHLQEKLKKLSELSKEVSWSLGSLSANATTRAATRAIATGVCNDATAKFLPGPDVTREEWLLTMPDCFIDLVFSDQEAVMKQRAEMN